MENDKSICVVCAWRQTCNKKFNVASSPGKRCPDFVRDLTLPRPPDEDNPEKKDQ
jgi:hypothetical protein